MRILVVKLTSMGDVLHLMPALTDLKKNYPEAVIDWMVEESFAELPTWHPGVNKTIAVATRRWRGFKLSNVSEFFSFLKTLRSQPYDVVVDAQGLIKSAVFGRFTKLARGGFRAGFSGDSIKESPAAYLYIKKIKVVRKLHAIERLRQLLAGAMNYDFDNSLIDYGLIGFDKQELRAVDSKLRAVNSKLTAVNSKLKAVAPGAKTILLFHGTTWDTKHLPEQLWHEIAQQVIANGYHISLAWGNTAERERAERLASDKANVTVLPKLNLRELAIILAQASGAIAVDTGLGHMAAALGVPCVSVYGSTDSALTGAMGKNQVRIQSIYPCSPCLLKQCPKLNETTVEPPCYMVSDTNPQMSAAEIWRALYEQIN